MTTKHPMIEQKQSIKRCRANLGYVFQDSDNDKGYWDKLTVSALGPPKKNPMIEQKQKDCFEDIGYVFNQTCNQEGYFDKITNTGINHLAKNPFIEQKGRGNEIGYTWSNFCGDKGMFFRLSIFTPKIISIL